MVPVSRERYSLDLLSCANLSSRKDEETVAGGEGGCETPRLENSCRPTVTVEGLLRVEAESSL